MQTKTVRIPENMAQEIDVLAKANNMSVNDLLVFCIYVGLKTTPDDGYRSHEAWQDVEVTGPMAAMVIAFNSGR